MTDDCDLFGQEIKELLQNYKQKKTTVYEPCTVNNYIECLIGLREELGLININYIFNPFVDIEDNKLCQEALVTLINAFWTLLYSHKNCKEKTERLIEQTQTLELKNKQLNQLVDRLNHKVNTKRYEAQACVASAQRTSDRSDEIFTNLNNTKLLLAQTIKQKESMEKKFKVENTRLHLENEQLLKKLKYQSGLSSICVCDDTIKKLKEKDKKQMAIISKLQVNNQELLKEVLALKENILLTSLSSDGLTKNETKK